MTDYRFTLRIDVTAVEARPDDIPELLGAGGCDDAIVGVGKPGRLALAFDRAADSAMAAILSAIHDVTRALPGAVPLEVTPDLVSVTELADLMARSRQNMRKLLLGGEAAAPAPVHEGSTWIWHLAPVLQWLRDVKDYQIAAELLDLARATMQVNLAIDRRNLDGSAQEEIRALLA